MLTRRATFRFAIGALQQSTRLYTALPLRCATQSTFTSNSPRLSVAISSRFYATPSKPKKGSIGESSSKAKPRKTAAQKEKEAAVKAAKAAKTKQEATVKKQKEAAVKAAKAAKAKQEAALKKQKAQEKKLKDKERAAAKKAKAAETKKIKTATKKAPKALTEKQKANLKARKDKQLIKELKEAALSPPIIRPVNAWTEFNTKRVAKAFLEKTESKIAVVSKESAQAYKQLSPAEVEHYNHLANEENSRRRERFETWLQKYTPDQIRAANAARTKLRTLNTTKKRSWAPLEDDRLVARPGGPYIFFYSERCNSGDLKHISLTDAAKLVGQEWKALSDTERQKYNDMHARATDQYHKDYLQTYGHAPPYGGRNRATRATPTATA